MRNKFLKNVFLFHISKIKKRRRNKREEIREKSPNNKIKKHRHEPMFLYGADEGT